MKLYLVSLASGLLVGVVYSILNVRSPAPPLVALLGLLGILAGEQIIPVGKKLVVGTSIKTAWREAGAFLHAVDPLPGGKAAPDRPVAPVAFDEERRT